MAIKKSQLYSALWDGCDELRGGMDASQYKDYVLVVLFVKYISDKAKKDTDMLISVPEGCSFDDMVALKGKTNIGEEMNKILEKLAEANGLTGVITNADFSDENKLGKGKDLVETVSKLIAVFQREELDFSNNRAADDDLIGDAYEYLMKNFASESGKSKGQFYTPAEVSRIMAKVIGIGKDERQMISIYDPTCGSGSLLLRAKAEAKHNVSIDGQEKDLATIGMARMSMIIHGVDDAELRHGDTLNDPLHKENDTTLQTFDYVVANPPFSMKGWRKSAKEQDTFGRWGVGEGFAPVPPPGCGDYAFLLHIVKSLKTSGHAACILPHGVLFRGGAEAEIRKFLVKKRWISGIIGLPTNLFYGTGIPACIIILDKEHAAGSKGVFMIDAKEGFQKDGAKNRLREQDIKLIVDTWEAHEPVPHYAKFVPFSEIEKNEYNLNIPRYVVPEDKEIQQDIYAHLHGGLPAHDVEETFASLWEACNTLKDKLFHKESNGYYSLIPAADAIVDAVNADASYKEQNAIYTQVIDAWCKEMSGEMKASVKEECEPKALIERWSAKLLNAAQEKLRLVDPYNVYEILMNWWSEAMQDDCYMVSRDGWKINLRETKKKSTFEDMECDLLPVSVAVRKFYSKEAVEIAAKRAELDDVNATLESIPEENPDAFDESLYEMLDKINETNVKKAIAAQKKGTVDADKATVKVWSDMLEKYARKKEIAKKVSTLIDDLTAKVRAKYDILSADEIRNLVIDDKWLYEFQSRSRIEIKAVCDSISSHICHLCTRYAISLPQLSNSVDVLTKKVGDFLNILSGRTRLPGYRDKWVKFSFTKTGIWLKGQPFSKADICYHGSHKCIHYGELFTTYGPIIDEIKSSTNKDISVASKKGDILFPASDVTPTGLGRASSINEDGVLIGGDVIIWRPTSNVCSDFISFCTNQYKSQIIERVTGTTVKHISSSALSEISFPIPPSIEEQKAVLEVLMSISDTIRTIEDYLEKYRLVRQGIMQTLLVDNDYNQYE